MLKTKIDSRGVRGRPITTAKVKKKVKRKGKGKVGRLSIEYDSGLLNRYSRRR